jgi:ABC-type methionine transport system permease subunit
MALLTLQATALNGALGGLPLLLGAIVTAGAAMVGIIGQGEGPVVNLRNGFNRLKKAIFAIIGVLVDIFVPVWNLFLDEADTRCIDTR